MNRVLGCLALSVAIIGCDSTGPTVDDGQDDDPFPGIQVTEPGTVVLTRDTIEIMPEGAPAPVGAARAAAAVEIEHNIVQVAQVLAPEVNDSTVQANDIIVDQSGHNAYIAYNYQGTPWVGALQIVDIRDRDAPVVTLQIAFPDMDINALDLDGNTLMVAGAVDPATTDGRRSFVSYLDLVKLSGDPDEALDEFKDNVTLLPSFAATGVARHSNRYYVGVGALNGSIQMLDMDLNVVDEWERGDIRDVDHYDNGIIALAGSTDAGLGQGDVIIARTNQFQSPHVFSIADFGSDYHKATIEVWDGTVALLGLSEAGWAAIDLRTEEILYTETNPSFEGSGCLGDGGDLLCNTNSVSTDGALLFTANGQYGFRVFRPKNKNEFDDYELVGFYDDVPDSGEIEDLEAWYSANHVELKSNFLFVASGPRGVFIYSLEKRNP